MLRWCDVHGTRDGSLNYTQDERKISEHVIGVILQWVLLFFCWSGGRKGSSLLLRLQWGDFHRQGYFGFSLLHARACLQFLLLFTVRPLLPRLFTYKRKSVCFIFVLCSALLSIYLVKQDRNVIGMHPSFTLIEQVVTSSMVIELH